MKVKQKFTIIPALESKIVQHRIILTSKEKGAFKNSARQYLRSRSGIHYIFESTTTTTIPFSQ